MDEFCEQAQLPKHINEKIKKALQYSSNKSILSISEKEDFFDSIPIKLKTSLAEGMFKGTITTVPFLKNKDIIFLANLLPMLQPLKMNMGDYVYHKNSFPNLIYFMIDGRVNLLFGPNEMTFKSFLAGSYFGEIEIFQQSLRMFSVRCEESCQFLTLDRDYLIELMDKFPHVEIEMVEMAQHRQELIHESLNKLQMLIELKVNNPFWKIKDTFSFAAAIAKRRKSQQIGGIDNNSSKFAENMSPIQQPQNSFLSPQYTSQRLIMAQNPTEKKTNFQDVFLSPTFSLERKSTENQDGQHYLDYLNSQDSKNANQIEVPINNNVTVQKITKNEVNEQIRIDGKGQIETHHGKNLVQINVFNEKKQPMLMEVYDEESKHKQFNVYQNSVNNNPMSSINHQYDIKNSDIIQLKENKLARIQEKYGPGKLDSIQERNSPFDGDNASNLCLNSQLSSSQHSKEQQSFEITKFNHNQIGLRGNSQSQEERKEFKEQKVIEKTIGDKQIEQRNQNNVLITENKELADKTQKKSNNACSELQKGKTINDQPQILKIQLSHLDDQHSSLNDIVMLDSSPENKPSLRSIHINLQQKSSENRHSQISIGKIRFSRGNIGFKGNERMFEDESSRENCSTSRNQYKICGINGGEFDIQSLDLSVSNKLLNKDNITQSNEGRISNQPFSYSDIPKNIVQLNKSKSMQIDTFIQNIENVSTRMREKNDNNSRKKSNSLQFNRQQYKTDDIGNNIGIVKQIKRSSFSISLQSPKQPISQNENINDVQLQPLKESLTFSGYLEQNKLQMERSSSVIDEIKDQYFPHDLQQDQKIKQVDTQNVDIIKQDSNIMPQKLLHLQDQIEQQMQNKQPDPQKNKPHKMLVDKQKSKKQTNKSKNIIGNSSESKLNECKEQQADQNVGLSKQQIKFRLQAGKRSIHTDSSKKRENSLKLHIVNRQVSLLSQRLDKLTHHYSEVQELVSSLHHEINLITEREQNKFAKSPTSIVQPQFKRTLSRQKIASRSSNELNTFLNDLPNSDLQQASTSFLELRNKNKKELQPRKSKETIQTLKKHYSQIEENI